ncbi:MAG: carbohydrate binding domain-containing protein [Candidatus Omnitrophota bacterium]
MVKKFVYVAMLVAMVCALAMPAAFAAEKAPVASGSELLVADFDSGEKPNNIGGDFGAWSKDPTDFSQGCTEAFDSVNRSGTKGFGMKLEYSVDSKNPAYNGFWMLLQNLDASKYDNVAFKVKGDAKIGYTTVFKIELKNAAKQVGRYYVTNITDQWQDVVIPLKEFKGVTDYSNLTEFVIVFEDRIASNKKGVIYLDDIRFTKNK